MQNNEIEVQQLLELDVEKLETLEQCSEAFGSVSQAADDHASRAVSLGKAAIMHAVKGGMICLRAKDLCDHGQFGDWKEQQYEKYGRSRQTVDRWMKLAKCSLMSNLLEDPKHKGLTDAYIATGMLPEPEPKPEGEGDKDKPPFSLSFRTVYRLPSEWNRDAAKDFLYEFDRLARLAMQLKTEFGL
jgi:hypothetical protein